MKLRIFPILLVVSAVALAQTPAPTSTSPLPEPVLSKKELGKKGFKFDDNKGPMCKVNGPEGACEVEAFVVGETKEDGTRHSCAKLDKATYVGHCVNGKLQGLSLVYADGSAKLQKEAFIAYFMEGRMALPAATSYLYGDLNFGIERLNCKLGPIEAPRCSSGCVYFGKWDRTSERCSNLVDIYGADFFSESNAKKLRDGNFDLDPYRKKFHEYFEHK